MFYYFSTMAPTGYSMTVNVDVTELPRAAKEAGVKFFPAYLWLVTKNLNEQMEFAVHSYENKPYYFPSVEAGKFFERDGRILMPLSLTCHHATTDGWHVSRFLEALNADLSHPERIL